MTLLKNSLLKKVFFIIIIRRRETALMQDFKPFTSELLCISYPQILAIRTPYYDWDRRPYYKINATIT
jgi:hypothetical protein